MLSVNFSIYSWMNLIMMQLKKYLAKLSQSDRVYFCCQIIILYKLASLATPKFLLKFEKLF